MHNELLYFIMQIFEELDGAKHYIQRAIEEKQTNPSRAKVFVEMSNSELTHAGNLYKMLDEDMKKAETTDDQTYITFLRDMQKEISKRYMKESAEVKYMHENFNK